MRAEQEFFEAAVASSDVVASVDNKVYPDIAPEGVLAPLIVYERRASEPLTTIHDGLAVASKVSIGATCWGRTRIEAEQLGDVLEVALRDCGRSVNRFAHFDQERDSYAAVLDFEIWELGSP